MEIQVLGSGSSGNCYLLKNKGATLLIECGIPYKQIIKSLKFQRPDGCLITHEHKDHSYSIRKILKNNINCYMSAGTAKALDVVDHYRVNTENIIKNDLWAAMAIDSIHDAIEPVNYLINIGGETVLYITDTPYVKYNFKNIKVDYLMIETNYIKEILDRNTRDEVINLSLRNRIVKTHMSLDTVKEFIKVNEFKNLKKIYAIHLSDTNSDAARIKKELETLTGIPVEVC